MQVERRAADDLEHVGGGGLLLQRFTQLVEQARVLDGDDGLRGKILNQIDLLVGERTDFRAVDDDCADQLIVLDHRDGEYGPITCEIDGGDDKGIALDVGVRRLDVGDVGHLLRDGDPPEGHVRRRPD